jgi:hypothetical protein
MHSAVAAVITRDAQAYDANKRAGSLRNPTFISCDGSPATRLAGARCICGIVPNSRSLFVLVRITPRASKHNATRVPLFHCRVNGSTPIPNRPLDIVWRRGIDINPIRLDDRDALRWLEACIWPDEGDRSALFREAVEVARRDPPAIIRGDIRLDIASVAAGAPKDATLIVFHSATLSYLNEVDRSTVAHVIGKLGATWISNESPSVLGIAAGSVPGAPHDGDFLLRLDARPVAWTDPHGTYMHWL